jgi:hypothetical protein
MTNDETEDPPCDDYQFGDEVRFPTFSDEAFVTGHKVSDTEVRITVRTPGEIGLDWQDVVERRAEWYFGRTALWQARQVPARLIPPLGRYNFEGTVTMRISQPDSDRTVSSDG